jgi:ABC-type nickel/cobalt efflux system permease component RcnA
MAIIAVVFLIFTGLVVLTWPRGGNTRRGSGFTGGGIPNDGAQPTLHHHDHHHHHHHDGGSWGGHHGGFDGGGGGHH